MPTPSQALSASQLHSVIVGRARAVVIDQLNTEWTTLSHSGTARAQVRRWAGQSRELAGCQTLEDVWARVRVADRSAQDDVLRLLLTVGQRSDQLARRTVFQMFLGAAINRGFSHPWVSRQSPDEIGQDIVASLWAAIATYPLQRRPHKIPANLVMETVRRLWMRRREMSRFDPEIPCDPVQARPLPGGDHTRSTSGMTELEWSVTRSTLTTRCRSAPPQCAELPTAPAVELLDVIAWGIDVGALSHDQAALLIRVYCPPPGSTGGHPVADELGLTRTALRQRCSRAVRSLAAAVSQSVASGELDIESWFTR